jgi:predicted restriction endonuclease
VIQRIGQDLFRQALIEYWNGQCPITDITDPALLRASHIVPWAECESDEQRLDVHNGLLLSALWDAAFDAGLVSFADDGGVLISPELGAEAKRQLGASPRRTIEGLTSLHQSNLQWHRKRYSPAGGWISLGVD